MAAIRAAQLGMKTAVIEKDQVGGRCLNYACIPAKAVLRVADVLSEIRDAGDFGIKVGEPEVDYAGVSARREKVIKTLTGGVAGLFKKNSIDVIEGAGALAGDGRVTVGDQTIAAKTIVLATGSVKRPIPGAEFGGRVIGTEEAWALNELPATMAVVGAGASGAEIASAYARLGVEVHAVRGARPRASRPRTPTSPRWPSAASSGRASTIHTGTLVKDIESGDSDGHASPTARSRPRRTGW